MTSDAVGQEYRLRNGMGDQQTPSCAFRAGCAAIRRSCVRASSHRVRRTARPSARSWDRAPAHGRLRRAAACRRRVARDICSRSPARPTILSSAWARALVFLARQAFDLDRHHHVAKYVSPRQQHGGLKHDADIAVRLGDRRGLRSGSRPCSAGAVRRSSSGGSSCRNRMARRRPRTRHRRTSKSIGRNDGISPSRVR